MLKPCIKSEPTNLSLDSTRSQVVRLVKAGLIVATEKETKMEDDDYQMYISDVSGAMEELGVEIEEETETVMEASKTEGRYSEIQNNEVIQREQSQALISDEQRFWAAVAEPPGLDYRRMITYYQENIDWILSDHNR